MRPAGSGASAGLPLVHLATAAAAFVLGALAVPWLAPELAGHYYQPRLLALTHTITLGWITLTIIGASYQFVPVVLGRALWSERLARWQFALLVGGVVGMVGHFWIGQWSGLVWGAAMVGVAVVTHLVNIGLTMRGAGKASFTARMVGLALVGLAMTALAGLLLGADRWRPFLPGQLFANLHAHVHIALLGWVLPMVLGVAARVLPMFLLAREPGGWPGRVQLAGLALGVPAVALGLVLAWAPLLAAGALAVAAAVTGHLLWVIAVLRRRTRPALDWGIRFVVTGAAFLVPATVLGIGFAVDLWSGPRVALAYAVLALGGWASLTIAGMMLKIVPFLVWYRTYGPRVGRGPVPTLGDLSWPRLEAVAYGLLVPGLAGLALAVWIGEPAMIRASGAVVAAGAVALATVLGRVLSHLRRAGRLEGSSLGAPVAAAAARPSVVLSAPHGEPGPPVASGAASAPRRGQ
jgi:hypothetical protein